MGIPHRPPVPIDDKLCSVRKCMDYRRSMFSWHNKQGKVLTTLFEYVYYYVRTYLKSSLFSPVLCSCCAWFASDSPRFVLRCFNLARPLPPLFPRSWYGLGFSLSPLVRYCVAASIIHPLLPSPLDDCISSQVNWKMINGEKGVWAD